MTNIISKRECGTCTACCTGTLFTKIFDAMVRRGEPCPYVCGGCTIYEDRPEICRNFQCMWLANPDNDYPAWLKPDVCNFVVSRKTFDMPTGPDPEELGYMTVTVDYLRMNEVGVGETKAVEFNLFYNFCMRRQINFIYYLDGGPFIVAPPHIAELIAAKEGLHSYDEQGKRKTSNLND